MLSEKCSGPILQNLDNNKVLIAFEVVPSNSDGGFCWSYGDSSGGLKWQVADSYMYPAGSGNYFKVEWKGDYSKMDQVAENDKTIVFATLNNRETYQLVGEKEFDQILSTFKFLDYP